MLESVLIANRGEIACRIIKTAKRMGIRTIAVYSDADAAAPHVRMADDGFHLGPAPARDSYLNVDRLLEAIAATNAASVHPGYGFLSENAEFAEACVAAGCRFVGPSPNAIRVMGSKIESKTLVASAGTPVVPGFHSDDQDPALLAGEAEKIGFPLLVKASAGGGGRGMRVVESADGFDAALAGARREALAAFADDRVFLERYLSEPKHIEVQILADGHGTCLYLFERDCSVQRRHQKVIEEAPAPTVDSERRRVMGEAAVKIARAIDYVGAGTVEFITEGDEFYFLEMNTRLQVEHPITEMILGLDLVEWQLKIAAGEALAFGQDDLRIDGHAIEARVYAENAKRKFLPSTGRLHEVHFPASVRADTGVATGFEVSVHYDPMIAKVVAHGSDRREAIARLDTALSQSVLAGVEHNMAFLRNVLQHEDFVGGAYTTGLIEQNAQALAPKDNPHALALAVVARTAREESAGPWSSDGFALNLPASQHFSLRHGRKAIVVQIAKTGAGHVVSTPAGEQAVTDVALSSGVISASVDGRWVEARLIEVAADVFVAVDGMTEKITFETLDAGQFDDISSGDGAIVAPLPGQVVKVEVAVNDSVKEGQTLLVVEAMKMEHTVAAPRDGVVQSIAFAAGERVDEGVELIALAPAT